MQFTMNTIVLAVVAAAVVTAYASAPQATIRDANEFKLREVHRALVMVDKLACFTPVVPRTVSEAMFAERTSMKRAVIHHRNLVL